MWLYLEHFIGHGMWRRGKEDTPAISYITIYQLYHHSITNDHHWPYITPDSHTIECLLINLQQANSLGMDRRKNIKEISRSEWKMWS